MVKSLPCQCLPSQKIDPTPCVTLDHSNTAHLVSPIGIWAESFICGWCTQWYCSTEFVMATWIVTCQPVGHLQNVIHFGAAVSKGNRISCDFWCWPLGGGTCANWWSCRWVSWLMVADKSWWWHWSLNVHIHLLQTPHWAPEFGRCGCYHPLAKERLVLWAHGSDGQISQRLSAWC